jgi:NAD(P)-dependent dehydrogenase (short-subunit alcohol dehydrogenase family)
MTKELQGKVGIVTGGTSGIGRGAAILFAKAGAKRLTWSVPRVAKAYS